MIDRLYRGESSWWPLIPGVILAGAVLVNEFDGFHAAVEKGWPLILVVIGLMLMAGVGTRRRHGREPRGTEPKGPHEA